MRACTILAMLVGGSGARAVAEPVLPPVLPSSAVELELRAPPACPPAAALRVQIAEIEPNASGRAHVHIREFGGRWTGRVGVGGDERTVTGTSCDDVMRAAALIVGLALRGVPVTEEEAGSVQDEDDEVPAGLDGEEDRRRTSLEIARSAPREVPRRGMAARASIGTLEGALPGLAALVRIGASFSGERAGARLDSAFATSARRVRLEDEVDALAQISLIAASGSSCLIAGMLWLCGGAELGRMQGTAEAGSRGDSGSGLWLAASLGPSLSLPLSAAVDLVLEGEAAVPIVYPRFSIDGVRLPGPSPVSLRSGFGLRVRLP